MKTRVTRVTRVTRSTTLIMSPVEKKPVVGDIQELQGIQDIQERRTEFPKSTMSVPFRTKTKAMRRLLRAMRATASGRMTTERTKTMKFADVYLAATAQEEWELDMETRLPNLFTLLLTALDPNAANASNAAHASNA